MQFITAHKGQLQTIGLQEMKAPGSGFVMGLDAMDELAGGKLALGAVHEVLWTPIGGPAVFFAAVLARAAAGNRAILWLDSQRDLYPPALATMGIPLEQVWIIRPENEADTLWATAECLRCKGAGATVSHAGRLSRIEARRLQLAAETGGGAGILLRPHGRISADYSAATRWLVTSAAGGRTLQRWKIQLLHGQTGRVGQSVFLEFSREMRDVRAVAELADRSIAQESARRASA